ncbi:hypothetical protein GCM10023329_42170 [Streptomyces sanyensis]|uniref:Uncharacterized protein n=1 Tax=Streptomyces sanyensis TaxID=568869 RepID=A0ABP9AXL8_9ACTN
MGTCGPLSAAYGRGCASAAGPGWASYTRRAAEVLEKVEPEAVAAVVSVPVAWRSPAPHGAWDCGEAPGAPGAGVPSGVRGEHSCAGISGSCSPSIPLRVWAVKDMAAGAETDGPCGSAP